jgi:hypothetical protein
MADADLEAVLDMPIPANYTVLGDPAVCLNPRPR